VQTDQCIDYIRRQPGWRLGGDFQDTLTGRTAKRRDYQRMLAEATVRLLDEDPGLIEPLMESLEHDLLPRDDGAAEIFGVRLHRFEASVERALRDMEQAA